MKAQYDGHSIKAQHEVVEKGQQKIRDAEQLALGKGGSQAIIAVPPTLSSPSEAATKNIPKLFHRQSG